MQTQPTKRDDDDFPEVRDDHDDVSIWGVRHPLAQSLLLCALYFIAARISVHLTLTPGGVSLLWLPNAVILSALLVSHTRRWPWILAAVIPGEIAADWGLISHAAALGFGIVNLCEVLLAATILRRLHGRSFSLERARHVASFGIVALLLAPGLAALVGSAIHAIPQPTTQVFWTGWLAWWLGDATGLLVLTPALHALWTPNKPALHEERENLRSWLGIGSIAGIALVSLIIFLQRIESPEQLVISPILILPLVLGVAARFGVSGATWAGFAVALISVATTVNGLGPYASLAGSRAVLLVQEYVMLTALSGFVMASLLHEARRRGDRLRLFGRAIEASEEGIAIAEIRNGKPSMVFANSRYGAQEHDFLDTSTLSPEAFERLTAAIEDGSPAREIVELGTSEETPVWIRMQLTPIRDANAALTHYVAVTHDISDLLSTQRQLTEAREALATQNVELERRVGERTAELQRLATTDPLTGIYNRRYVLERAAQELSRSRRRKHPLSLAILDIDRFKNINDQYGHAFGDNVLNAMCAVVQRELRPADTFARFGGEEFVLLLPDTDADGAFSVAERVRVAIAALSLDQPDGKPITITVSLGISTLGRDADNLDEMLHNADAALYRAKDEGRNRVMPAEAAHRD